MANKRDKEGHVLKPGEYWDEKNNRYMFRKMIKGKRFSVTANDLVYLRKQENELLVQLDRGDYTNKSNRKTLNEYFDFWLEVYAKSGRKATTCTNYKSYFDGYIRDDLGKKRITEIKKADCQKIINEMVKKGLKHSTLANLKACLNIVFECAIDDELINKNPVRNIQLPRTESTKRKPVEEENISKFLNYVKVDKRYSYSYPAFVFLFNSGCRIGEMAALTWNDIDFENDEITISKSLNRYRKKDYGFTLGCASTKSITSNRKVVMSKVMKISLLEWKLQSGTNDAKLPYLDDTGIPRGEVTGFVFFNSYGHVWCEPTFRRLMKNIIDSYNKENSDNQIPYFCPHEVRHTYTSIAYSKGLDVTTVSERLGHASTAVTMDVYAHLSNKKKAEQEELVKAINIS